MAFARSEGGLNKRQEDGATLRQHYQMAAIPPKELTEAPECPAAGFYIWNWFAEHLRSRARDELGNYQPLSYLELLSWTIATRTKLSVFEVMTLRQMDQAYLEASKK